MTDSTHASRKWNVGDEIVVVHANYSRQDPHVTTETITRVARKYFYIAKNSYGDETAFEISTGREKDGQNYYAVAYTPAGWEAKQFRDGVIKKLFEHKVSSNSYGTMTLRTWSDGHLCELLELLDRVKAEQQANDGDA